MTKQILPVGTEIEFATGHRWVVHQNNVIVFPATGQKSNLMYYSKKDYKVVEEPKISKPSYNYQVQLSIDVNRTDGALLTAEENIMVLKMQEAAEKMIGEIMSEHGQNKSKVVKRNMSIY